VIAVPEEIRQPTSPYEGEVYVEVDFYVLYGEDKRVGINVPGHHVCREGDQLRSIHPITFKETKTDNSMCYPLPYGEPERIHCPPAAHSVITTNTFLSSPIAYTVNICLLYDTSNCEWRPVDDGKERMFCKPGGEYKGIWAAGTQFHYRCTKSDTQQHVQALQYGVRFMQSVEFPEGRTRRRLLRTETRHVMACN
jgi:hypothetical protein